MDFVLLDRDGVVNEACRHGYVTDPAAVRLLPGAADAISRLNRNGYRLVVVSNQQCVGSGLLTPEGLDRVTEAIRGQVAAAGGRIEEFLYCPHLASAGCTCRKPAPGLLFEAHRRYGFDLQETFFVGDCYTDVEAAHRAHCRSIFVLSGLDADRYRAGEALPYTPDYVAADLAAAVRIITGPAALCGRD